LFPTIRGIIDRHGIEHARLVLATLFEIPQRGLARRGVSLDRGPASNLASSAY
jgi:hypothetical protein